MSAATLRTRTAFDPEVLTHAIDLL